MKGRIQPKFKQASKSQGSSTKIKACVHIGMHKTGSTHLQRNVFPLLFKSSRVDDRNSLVNEGRFYELLMKNYSKFRSSSQAEIGAHFINDLDKSTQIVSVESLSGRIKPKHLGQSYEEFCAAANALKTLAENYDIRVIIFFREHKSWLTSVFGHLYRSGRFISPDKLLSMFNSDDMSYSRRLAKLEECNINYRAYNYEDLRKRPLPVILDICSYWELEQPESLQTILNKEENSTPTKQSTLFLWRAIGIFEGLVNKVLRRNKLLVTERHIPETLINALSILDPLFEYFKPKLVVDRKKQEIYMTDWNKTLNSVRKISD